MPRPAELPTEGTARDQHRPQHRPQHRRRLLDRPRHLIWVRRGALALLVVLLVEYVVLPQLVGARGALDLLGTASPRTLVLAVGLEAASLLCYTALTRSVLGARGSISFWTLLRIDLTGLGVSHVVPGGGATAAGMRLRLLAHAGVEGGKALTVSALQTAAELVVLIVLFATGVAFSLSATVGHPLFVTAGVVALVAAVLIALLLVALLLVPDRTRAAVRRVTALVPHADQDAAGAVVTSFADDLRALAHDRRKATRVVASAGGNWLLDACCLWVCLWTFGYAENPGHLLAVYGLVNLIALMPITPGGLGIVEGVLVPSLVSFGAPHEVALVGVLTWRLVQFWLPIPVSWCTYLSLRTGVFRDRDLESRLMPTGRVTAP